MILDTTNAYGMAGLFVVPGDGTSHGMNYVIHTNGTGEMMRNGAGQLWEAFDALPTVTTLALNADANPDINATFYIATKALAVDIEDVVEWSPWTILMTDGTWYLRGDVRGAWQTAQTPETAASNPSGPPSKLPEFVDQG